MISDGFRPFSYNRSRKIKENIEHIIVCCVALWCRRYLVLFKYPKSLEQFLPWLCSLYRYRGTWQSKPVSNSCVLSEQKLVVLAIATHTDCPFRNISLLFRYWITLSSVHMEENKTADNYVFYVFFYFPGPIIWERSKSVRNHVCSQAVPDRAIHLHVSLVAACLQLPPRDLCSSAKLPGCLLILHK